MSVALAVALLALLVASCALVALVAVYARVRGLEAGRGAELSGYATLVGRPAPAAVRPRAGEGLAVVAVLDAGCALCHAVWDAMSETAADSADSAATRFVGLVDRVQDGAGLATGRSRLVELLADVDARADLFEGYSPTLLAVDATGIVTRRHFVYPDTDLRSLLLDLPGRREVTQAP